MCYHHLPASASPLQDIPGMSLCDFLEKQIWQQAGEEFNINSPKQMGVIRTGTADIGEKYLTVIRKAAGDYTKEIFHKLREREYNPELMRLYVVGGGGCMIQNFGEYDKSRVTIVRDICATAKGYEAMTVRKIQRNGGMLV